MNQKFNLKNLAPHILAVVVFIIINVVMYWPLFLENKTLNQNDILQGAGANQEIIEHREATGEEALWTNGMFSGMPAYLINVQWSGELTKHIRKVISFGLPSPANHTFVAMLAFYILLLVFRVNPYLAIAGGFAYGLNTFFLISVEAGHIWKVAAISYMPLVLAGIVLTFRKKYLLGFVLTALAMALEISSNHYQITYYLLFIVLIFGVFKLIDAIKNKTLPEFGKTIGILIIAVLLGIGANIGKIWTAYEYGKYSIRGQAVLSSNTQSTGGLDRDYAFAWSNGIWEPLTFLIPNFYGGASQEEVSMNSKLAEGLRKQGAGSGQIRSFVKSVPTYWGDQPFTSGPYYLGAIAIFLFVLGILVVKGPVKWWLVIASVLGIVLSWGDNFEAFNYFMFDYFPGYNKFRSVSMTVTIPFLCMPLLGFIGLQKLIDEDWNKTKKSLFYAAGVVAGLCLIFIAGSFMMRFRGTVDPQLGDQAWLVDLIRDQRASMMRGDAFRSLIFVVLAAAVIYFMGENKIKKYTAILLIAGLILVDYIPVAKRYLNDENFKRDVKGSFFAKSQADERILQDDGHYRVLNLNNPFNEARTSYYHSSIGGYHGAKMRRYQDLIEYHLQSEINELIEGLRAGNTDFSDFDVINMLNTKYIKFGAEAGQVIVNQAALGNAWFVRNLQKVNTPDEAIEALGNIDTENTAVINSSEFTVAENSFMDGTIELDSYAPNQLEYSSKNADKGLAVFSEVYYPKGWKAYIDGKEVEILQVNYVLRALEIPAGEHEVVFKFEPQAYYIGNKIMMGSSIVLILLLLGSLFYSVKKSKVV
ncbi:YfhO family protein [Marivirga sp. S37H4]|uniref:YfhO family protein n=1 Tax=Marivirga aurantiaca TaxID=2802615 RepID=A0A934WVN3_9BACT|nr:YfhO family protein [Marivirga aurantiaca]MBK6263781.1 YfhO family protein [Marivirga aurantiaca]